MRLIWYAAEIHGCDVFLEHQHPVSKINIPELIDRQQTLLCSLLSYVHRNMFDVILLVVEIEGLTGPLEHFWHHDA
jgi:hypothetical protein